jgi:hypothetical protein
MPATRTHGPGRAQASLRHQADDLGSDHVFSLDACWRAVGSPAGREPPTRGNRASPLIPSLKAYYREIGRDLPEGDPDHPWRPGEMGVVSSPNGDSEVDDAFQAGDLTTNLHRAGIYADFLDGRAARAAAAAC